MNRKVSTATSPHQERQKQQSVQSPTLTLNSQTGTSKRSSVLTPPRVNEISGELWAMSLKALRGTMQEMRKEMPFFVQARGQEPRAEEAAYPGSTPSHFPPQTQALSTQTPGHIGSMPHGGPKNPHANAGRAAEQPASGGGSSSTLDQDIAQYRRLVETLRRQRDEERFCVEQRAKEEELAALRREYEQLQTAVSQPTPRVRPAIGPDVSRDLGPGGAWGNLDPYLRYRTGHEVRPNLRYHWVLRLGRQDLIPAPVRRLLADKCSCRQDLNSWGANHCPRPVH